MIRMYKNVPLVGAALSAALALGIPLMRVDYLGWSRPGTRQYRPSRTSIAQANRWTGKPHENRREIARRQRQEAARG